MNRARVLGIFRISLLSLCGLHLALGSTGNEFAKPPSGPGETSESDNGIKAFKNGKDKHAAYEDEISGNEKAGPSEKDVESLWEIQDLDEIMDNLRRVYKIGRYSNRKSNEASEIGEDGIPGNADRSPATAKEETPKQVPARSEEGNQSRKKEIRRFRSQKSKQIKDKTNISQRKRMSKFLLSILGKKPEIFVVRPPKSFLEDFGKVLNEIRVKKQISALDRLVGKTSQNDVEIGQKLGKSIFVSSSNQKKSRLMKNLSLRLSPRRDNVELINNFGKSKSIRETEISRMKGKSVIDFHSVEILEEEQPTEKPRLDDGLQAEVIEKALSKEVDLITRGSYYLRHKNMSYLQCEDHQDCPYKDFNYAEKLEQICNQIWNRFVLPYNPQAEKFKSFPLKGSMQPVTNVSFESKVARKGVELGSCGFDGVSLKVLLGPHTGPQFYLIALPNPTAESSIVQDCLWEEDGHWVYRGIIS